MGTWSKVSERGALTTGRYRYRAIVQGILNEPRVLALRAFWTAKLALMRAKDVKIITTKAVLDKSTNTLRSTFTVEWRLP